MLQRVAAIGLIIGVTSTFSTSALAGENDLAPSPDSELVDESNQDKNVEKSETSFGTEADYQSLLSLKTSDYQAKSVTEFNKELMNWANQNEKSYNNIIENDLATQSFPTFLTAEERNFISLTVAASNAENVVQVRSYYTGKVPIA